MANFDRLRGRRDLPEGRDDDPAAASRYPGSVSSQSKERA
jgi:hypothetical protein